MPRAEEALGNHMLVDWHCPRLRPFHIPSFRLGLQHNEAITLFNVLSA
jgi:hypothetical protein